MMLNYISRDNLHRDAQGLWEKLLAHYILLVKSRVMDSRAVAHVFVPCLVHANSRQQATVSYINTQLTTCCNHVTEYLHITLKEE